MTERYFTITAWLEPTCQIYRVARGGFRLLPACSIIADKLGVTIAILNRKSIKMSCRFQTIEIKSRIDDSRSIIFSPRPLTCVRPKEKQHFKDATVYLTGNLQLKTTQCIYIQYSRWQYAPLKLDYDLLMHFTTKTLMNIWTVHYKIIDYLISIGHEKQVIIGYWCRLKIIHIVHPYLFYMVNLHYCNYNEAGTLLIN